MTEITDVPTIVCESAENLRVNKTTTTQAFTRTIVGSFKNNHTQIIDTVGAGPSHTACKAIASAAMELQKGPTGIKDILVKISWFDATGLAVDPETGEKTETPISGIRFETMFAVDDEEE